MNEHYYVYLLTNKKTNKMYVGATSRDPAVRWKSGFGYEHNKDLANDIRRFGWNNGFDKEIIASNLSADEAYNFEIILIEKLSLTDPRYGYNKSSGGRCGSRGAKRDDAFRYAISKKNRERYRNSLSAEERIKYDAKRRLLGQPVRCVESGMIYKSFRDAQRQTGISEANIRSCCVGRLKTSGGFHWECVDKDYYDWLQAKKTKEKQINKEKD